jgi:hypothetical protein
MWQLPNAILNLIPLLGLSVKVIFGLLISWFGHNIVFGLSYIISHLFGLTDIVGAFSAMASPAGIGATLDFKSLLSGALGPLQTITVIILILLIMNLLVPLILGVLIWFSLLFIFFKIFFLLINSYIKILLAIILSPIYLLFEAVPGQSAFANWIKGLFGELITFPLVVGIFTLGSVVVEQASSGNLVKFPFLVGIDSKSFGVIIGMVLLFMTPDLVKAVRQIFIPKPGLLDAAGPGVLFGGVGAAVGGGMGAMGQFGSMSLALGALGPTGVFAGLGKKLGLGRFLGPYTNSSKSAGNTTQAE